MKTIYKYPVDLGNKFNLNGEFRIEMPKNAEILAVQTLYGEPRLWALVNPNAETELRNFKVIGTGHNVDEKAKRYIGTFQLNGGALVYHLFES